MTNTKAMDWHLVWTALGVIIPVIATTVACFVSLSNRMREVESRLTTIETVMIIKNIIPKELIAVTEEK